MPSQAWLMQRMCVGADEDREFDQFGEIGGGDEDDEDDWKRRARTLRSALTLFPSDLPPALASGSELPNATSRKFEQFTAGRELSPERQSAPPARPPTAGR
ncbi:hypothetical protein GPALN_003776 [Globodera pallida]|nr:hypothetical protein GPALN_003776 [Globodera pallida]